MSSFSERLRFAMSEAGMTQAALAEKTGASKAAISQYLSGKNVPGILRIEAIAEATGVSFDFLAGIGVAAAKDVPRLMKKIRVRDAARCMGKSEQFVRVGLQRGLLPFGNAVPGTGNRWSYYINPTKFREFVGEDAYSAMMDA